METINSKQNDDIFIAQNTAFVKYPFRKTGNRIAVYYPSTSNIPKPSEFLAPSPVW